MVRYTLKADGSFEHWLHPLIFLFKTGLNAGHGPLLIADQIEFAQILYCTHVYAFA